MVNRFKNALGRSRFKDNWRWANNRKSLLWVRRCTTENNTSSAMRFGRSKIFNSFLTLIKSSDRC